MKFKRTKATLKEEEEVDGGYQRSPHLKGALSLALGLEQAHDKAH